MPERNWATRWCFPVLASDPKAEVAKLNKVSIPAHSDRWESGHAQYMPQMSWSESDGRGTTYRYDSVIPRYELSSVKAYWLHY